MSCGIICRIDPDEHPLALRKLTHYNPPEPDRFFERLLFVVCVIWSIGILGLLAYGAISTIVAAV